ncbi:YcxB family protein [Shewanella litorisediminis]|uniref:YcxB family protein n=1 Tax=Shewanella litorisediminis TaxID=1173586 RepID=A0ABX7G179_9GAMM|nr:YcxB family protein [Shewanella litorisediminis]MCL2918981.1 YcxB family protein [Shewanella litorisediminis]QRH01048.1 YcxB family protein [Shewanella litorisediminis]
MPTSLNHQHSFILNRAHFEECFDESVTPLTGPKRHIKTLGFGLMTFALLASPLPSYVGWFFLGLTVLEFLSVRYQRTWWLWRQLMSRAAGNEVTVTLTDKLLITESLGQKRELAWDSLDAITPTARGFLLQRGRARQYLSASGLSPEALAFLTNFNSAHDEAQMEQ